MEVKFHVRGDPGSVWDEQIQLFSNYSHVGEHQRQAKKNQVVRGDYFLRRYVRTDIKISPIRGLRHYYQAPSECGRVAVEVSSGSAR